MKWTKLSNTSAFGPGSSLWLIPSIEKSEWARKLDWYLNLQISRSRNHVTKDWSNEIKDIVTENEIELKPFKASKKQPMLVGTKRPLPFDQVVEIPFDGNSENWVQTCEEVWRGLGEPSVRLFLPPSLSANELQSTSKNFRAAEEFTFIETEKG